MDIIKKSKISCNIKNNFFDLNINFINKMKKIIKLILGNVSNHQKKRLFNKIKSLLNKKQKIIKKILKICHMKMKIENLSSKNPKIYIKLMITIKAQAFKIIG